MDLSWNDTRTILSLGFSWESHVLDIISDSLDPEALRHGRFKRSMNSQLERIDSAEEVQRKYEAARETNNTLLAPLWPEIRIPLLKRTRFCENLLHLAKESELHRFNSRYPHCLDYALFSDWKMDQETQGVKRRTELRCSSPW